MEQLPTSDDNEKQRFGIWIFSLDSTSFGMFHFGRFTASSCLYRSKWIARTVFCAGNVPEQTASGLPRSDCVGWGGVCGACSSRCSAFPVQSDQDKTWLVTWNCSCLGCFKLHSPVKARHDTWDCHRTAAPLTPHGPPLAVSRQSYGSPMERPVKDELRFPTYREKRYPVNPRSVPLVRTARF